MYHPHVYHLGYQHNSTADLPDLLLGQLGDELGLDNDGLAGELALAQDLEDAVLGHVNDGGDALVLGGSNAGLGVWDG